MLNAPQLPMRVRNPAPVRLCCVQMYRYPLVSNQNWPSQAQTFEQFATAGFQQAEPLSVPPPESLAAVYRNILVENMKELHALVNLQNKHEGVGLLCLKALKLKDACCRDLYQLLELSLVS